MITKQVWLKAILALFLSICIAFYVNQFLKSMSTQVEVVVAAQNIPAKTTIESSMLKIIRVHADDQSLLVPHAIGGIAEAIGSITLVPLQVDEVLVNEEAKLVRPDQTVIGLSHADTSMPKAYFIPTDQRAISLKVDAEGSLGFSLNAGDKVDVIFTSLNVDTGGIYAKTILKGVSIFDVSTISEKDRQSNTSTVLQNITLLVSPSDAQLLALSKRKGKIDFVLTPLTPDSKQWSFDKPTYPAEIYKEVEKR
jgi:Flp pilus assembly protein CpaB